MYIGVTRPSRSSTRGSCACQTSLGSSHTLFAVTYHTHQFIEYVVMVLKSRVCQEDDETVHILLDIHTVLLHFSRVLRTNKQTSWVLQTKPDLFCSTHIQDLGSPNAAKVRTVKPPIKDTNLNKGQAESIPIL